MIALSEISMPAVCAAPGPPALTDGAIAVLNLQAQIDGLEGHGTSAEAATLIDLLILRGLILGRISDYERAAQLADRPLDDRRRRLEIGVADTENDHILAALARGNGRVVCQPRRGAFPTDAIDECREPHALTVRGRC